MKVLFLAPQPFYQERGTPIAVRLAIETIVRDCNRVVTDGEVVRLLTYAEGEEIQLPGTKIERVGKFPFLQGIGPGVSIRKLAADFLLMCKTVWLLVKSNRKEFVIIHAVEEAVFIAALAKMLFGIPYIYDMDSSLSLQLTDQWRWLRPVKPVFEAIERFVISRALAVAPVCSALVEVAQRQGAARIVLLSDFSLLQEDDSAPHQTRAYW
jgi:Glycosyl transferase 4-like domain